MTPHNAPPIARFLPDPSPSPASNGQDNGGVMTTIHAEMTIMPSPTPINNHAGGNSGTIMDDSNFTSSSIGGIQQAVHLNGDASPLAESDAFKEVLYTTVISAINTVPIITNVIKIDGGRMNDHHPNY
ncbi:hypothetical protein BDQ12DRAFT_353487 [Crucibulum laeve]|uniref:Uncharacterized protein n=1 Tax=Crucibulum laeve TaxID=68775 RepID=A0A5C3MCF8_9AGAR|nr:hypothetical protein BDQ12DRAFT_353487 [Crucibulum laeve]